MSTADGPPPSARPPATRLTPARVRSTQFPKATVGRRGYSADAVDQFVRRMAEEITGRDAAEANLRAQLDRLRRALKQWQSRQLERRDPTGVHPALTPGDQSVDAVNTLSQAQQQADAYIAQAQEYCRQITADARNRADAILCEAQERAEATTAQALRTYEARQRSLVEQAEQEALAVPAPSADVEDDDALAVPPPAPEEHPVPVPAAAATGAPLAPGKVAVDLDELDRRLTWARSFVAALQSVETQLTTSRQALDIELEALDRLRRPADGTGSPAIDLAEPGTEPGSGSDVEEPAPESASEPATANASPA